jgi:hypothetical protein
MTVRSKDVPRKPMRMNVKRKMKRVVNPEGRFPINPMKPKSP